MDKKALLERVKELGLHTIRVEFSDMYGVSRGKMVPASRLEEVLEEGINCAKPTFSLDLSYNIPPGTGTADEVNYEDMTIIPDPATFMVIPYQEGLCRLIGDLYADGKPFPYSPRGLLKKVVEKYREKGLIPISASELEFFVFESDGDNFQYYCDKPSNVYTVGPRSDPKGLLTSLQNTLVQMGIDVLYINHEFFQSQYEINWRHQEALTMADQTFTFKMVCKELAFLNDLFVTFMARPKNEMGGSGYHIHFSIQDAETGKNLFDDPNGKEGMSDLMRYFIGGQMAHAKAMTPFLAPTINSYKRYVLNSFAPYYLAWGLDNRTTYIRVPRERGAATRVENRAACASANPYLALAVALIAGLDGIEKQLDPGDYYVGDIYTEEPGKFDTVPFYLQEAIEELKKDKVLCEAIGEEIINNYTAVKMSEVERFRTYVTEWEFNEYFYHL
ncbi:MAG: glutamine synthetase [Deltaproteobacteria bacterium]|nr:glutamine synthetase [Deltaproteobacteria bacterium]MBW2024537.1 glutamine synthetase [Deltaproteobacteria bacterium]MBW2124734.1 glutamine synthetase [Deltaproteobacteria bacterium]